MSALLPDTDSDDELPPGWEERTTLDGKVYYANHEGKSTQWTHPQTGKKKKVSGELPFGWVRMVADDNQVYYIDKINNKTTYTDPRLAFAVEEKDSPHDIRQRFDASSTAFQVLSGRDLSDKVAIITGANCGIGFETARALTFHGAEVVFACRDMDKAESAINQLHLERSHIKACAIKLDLNKLSSVYDFAQKFVHKYSRLDMLILNAGVFGTPHALTDDGFEQTFQVNHLSQFYLISLLQPILVQSAPARVVVVSSESHRFSMLNASNISQERLSPSSSSGFIAMVAYNDSKLCNVLITMELQRRLAPQGVTCSVLHPGNMVASSLARHWWIYRLLFFLVRPFTKSLAQAAATSVYCATAVELEGVGGMYFNNCCRCQPSAASCDLQLQAALWDISERMLDTMPRTLDHNALHP